MPIVKTIVEIGQFDTQLLKVREQGFHKLYGSDYQKGEQLGFWNVREYILFRDNYTCQCCKGKSKDPILNVHHIQSRMTGGNAPNNLVTLCETCHRKYHKGIIDLPKNIKRGVSFKDIAYMNIMRWNLLNRLRAKYGNSVYSTYGYITKNTRTENKLPKGHTIDARCISGNPNAISSSVCYFIRKIRCHNRQLHQNTIRVGGIRRNTFAPKELYGYRLWDSVLYNGISCFVAGRRNSGSFHIINIYGKYISHSITYRKLLCIGHNNSYLFGI